jgi:hypothetical protein
MITRLKSVLQRFFGDFRCGTDATQMSKRVENSFEANLSVLIYCELIHRLSAEDFGK